MTVSNTDTTWRSSVSQSPWERKHWSLFRSTHKRTRQNQLILHFSAWLVGRLIHFSLTSEASINRTGRNRRGCARRSGTLREFWDRRGSCPALPMSPFCCWSSAHRASPCTCACSENHQESFNNPPEKKGAHRNRNRYERMTKDPLSLEHSLKKKIKNQRWCSCGCRQTMASSSSDNRTVRMRQIKSSTRGLRED